MWSATRAGQLSEVARSSSQSTAGRRVTSVIPGLRFDTTWWKACRAANHGERDEVVGEQHVLVGGQLSERETHVWFSLGPQEAEGEGEVDGQFQVDVEELRSEEEGVEMGVQVADIEAPENGPFHLSPAFPTHLVEIGVVPDVGQRPRETPIAVE